VSCSGCLVLWCSFVDALLRLPCFCCVVLALLFLLSISGCHVLLLNWREEYQRPRIIHRHRTHAVLCLGWLDIFWNLGRGGSSKGSAVPLAYAQSYPAVKWGVLQLWIRRVMM
jgi:hypothetical protein